MDIKAAIKRGKSQVATIARAMAHPKTPLHVKIIGAGLVAYVLSPIDLIPDGIPILGQLDDLVVIAIGASLIARMMPQEVWAEASKASESPDIAEVAASRPCDGGLHLASGNPGRVAYF